jgi:glucose-1-phosphate cytidylyltransferase
MLAKFRTSNAVASLLLVQPKAKFDIVKCADDGIVQEVCPLARTGIWINGGFFAMRNEIFQYIQPGEELVREPFERLIAKEALLPYQYSGFWQCMDTFEELQRLEKLNEREAPWKVWKTRPAAQQLRASASA